ncbi:hypothetical protein OSCT_0293 [Oscillochloris trichoides DG-6]|uniref:Uncharacterized protein n=1 Tax=Oscillochloris trichoides DG-6 TaxID=765420 RepID=E1IAE2_9CHLR|nr:hypothetical protein OSCT_0293 [Oscillochloris trichoides DG-6]
MKHDHTPWWLLNNSVPKASNPPGGLKPTWMLPPITATGCSESLKSARRIETEVRLGCCRRRWGCSESLKSARRIETCSHCAYRTSGGSRSESLKSARRIETTE